jgi:hypothetical protein
VSVHWLQEQCTLLNSGGHQMLLVLARLCRCWCANHSSKGPLCTHTHTHTLHAWMDDMRRVSADDEILHCEQQGFEWRVGVVRTPGGRERQRRRRQSQRRQRPGPSSRTTSSQQSALSSRTPGTASSASSSAEAPSASRRCSALDSKCVVSVGRQSEQPHTRGATSNKRVHE